MRHPPCAFRNTSVSLPWVAIGEPSSLNIPTMHDLGFAQYPKLNCSGLRCAPVRQQPKQSKVEKPRLAIGGSVLVQCC